MTGFKKILRNILSLAAGEFLVRFFNLLSYSYLARILLPGGFGSINFAAAIIPFFLVAVNYGLETTAIRDISINPNKLAVYISNITLAKVINAVISYIALCIFVSISGIAHTDKYLILIYGLLIFSNAIMVGWAFRALEETLHLTIVQLIIGILNLTSVIVFIHNPNQLIETIWILVLTGFLNSFIIIIIVFKFINPIQLSFDPELIKKLFRESSPVALSMIMICIYYNLDQVMLGLIVSNTDVAFYSASYKIFIAAIIPASIIFNAFYPQLSKARENVGRRSELMNSYSQLMFGGGMFIAMIGILFSEQIIILTFGTLYIESVDLFSILMINSILVFINMTYGNPLLAWKMDKKYLMAISAGALSNMILNLLLIPRYHAYGAVAATICSEVIVLIGVVYYHYSFAQELYINKLLCTVGLTFISFIIGKLIMVLMDTWLVALSAILIIHPFLMYKTGLIPFKYSKRIILHEI